MILLALLLLQTNLGPSSTAPFIPADDPAKMALARQLAETGTLATLLPMLIDNDLSALTAEQPALTDAQKAQVKQIGHRIADARRAQLMEAFARGYAERLSMEDLRALVAFAKRPEAAHKRAVDLPVTVAAMQSVGGVDLKKETAAAACAEAKLLCDRR